MDKNDLTKWAHAQAEVNNLAKIPWDLKVQLMDGLRVVVDKLTSLDTNNNDTGIE